ncbi:hypothetical protein BGZ83_009454, partial [Gryganskiella cystojenkinii]
MNGALPHNQNINITTKAILDYGLVTRDITVVHSDTTLSGMIAAVMNRNQTANFRIKVNDKDILLPPSRLLLRRIAVALNVSIIMPSTRAKTLVFRSEDPLCFVGLLHVGNSFEEVSTYTPLTLSKTPPIRPQSHSLQLRLAAPEVEAVQLAVYRNSARAQKQHSSLKHLDLNKALEFFEEECKRIIKTDIIKSITKLLPRYSEVQDEQSRLSIVTKGYDKAKSEVTRRSNNKTPPRGSVAVMTRRLEGFHAMEKNSILEMSLTHKMRDSSGFSAAATFTRLVETNFDNIWQEQMTAALSVPADNHGSQPTNNQSSVNENASKPEYRTCELPLSRILRQDFTEADIEHIHSLFKSSQENLSAHMDQINIGILKAYTEIYQGLLHPSNSVTESLDINMFLPATFTIRDQELLANPKVNIVRTNIEFLKAINEACKTKDEATDDDTENRLGEDTDGDATTDPRVKPKANRRAASK